MKVGWGALLVGLLVLVASVAAVTPVAAKAPPEPVCGVCTSALDRAAARHGVSLERGTSTMTLDLAADGSAVFAARVEITRGADDLRNATLRAAIVRDVSDVLVEERQDLRTAMDGETLIVRYRGDGLAHTTLGVLRFDAFVTRDAPPLWGGGEGSPYPGADRLTLRAPAGYRVHGAHGQAGTDTSIVWYGDSHEQFAGDIAEDVVISFVPADAALPGLRVAVAAFVDRITALVPAVAPIEATGGITVVH